MATSIPIQPQAITERTKDWVIAHEPGTDNLHAGRMEIIAWAVSYPDDREPQWESCGKEYDNCRFIAGLTGRRCGLNFFIMKDSVLQPVTFRRKPAEVACGQRAAAKER